MCAKQYSFIESESKIFVFDFFKFSNVIIFAWDPDAELAFQEVSVHDLSGNSLIIYNEDNREDEFVVPMLGLDKFFSMFQKVQDGVSLETIKTELNRLNDQFYRYLDNGMAWRSAYKYMTQGEPLVLRAEVGTTRKTKNSQVKISLTNLKLISNFCIHHLEKFSFPYKNKRCLKAN